MIAARFAFYTILFALGIEIGGFAGGLQCGVVFMAAGMKIAMIVSDRMERKHPSPPGDGR